MPRKFKGGAPPVPPRLWVRAAILLGLALAAAAVAAFVVNEPPTRSKLYPRCQFHALTGLHCPGCGMTRCVYALLIGDPAQALAYNAMAVVTLPVLGWACLNLLRSWLRGSPLSEGPPGWAERHSRSLALGYLALMAVYGVARNVPAEPFTRLAPHELPVRPK